jgi:hypothetical protein
MKDGQCYYCLTQYPNTHEGHAKLGECRKECAQLDEDKRYAEINNNETRDTLSEVNFTDAQIEALIECFGKVE